MADDIDVGIGIHTRAEDIKSAQDAADAVDHFTATVEQSREAMRRSGGDFEQYKKILLEIVSAEQAAADAAEKRNRVPSPTPPPAPAPAPPTTPTGRTKDDDKAEAQQRRLIALQQQATAEDAKRDVAERRLIVTQQQAITEDGRREAAERRLSLAHAQAITEDERRTVALAKIPLGARTAANALSALTSNVVSGNGSLSSYANSAGAAAFGLSQLSGSASIAAGAAGLGAVVTVVGVLIGLYETFSDRQEKVNAKLGDLSRNIAGLNPEQLTGRLQAVDATIETLIKRRNELDQRLSKAIASPIGLFDMVGIEREIGRLDTRMADLFAQRDKLATAAAESATATEKQVTDVTIKANEDALESYLKRTQGETAARRQQIAFEEQAAIGTIRLSGDTETKRNAAIDAIRRKAAADRAALDAAERERILKAETENELRVAKLRETSQVAASKAAGEEAEAANDELRAKRLISEREFIRTRETLALSEIGRELQARLDSINQQIAAEEKLLAATKEPEKRASVQGRITALSDQRTKVIADAKRETAKITATATHDTAELTRKLGEAVNDATAETLEAQGQIVEAAAKRIHQKFDDLIREALAAKDTIKAAALTAARDLELQTAQRQQFDQTAGRAAQASANQIARVNSLLSVHAITTGQARAQIVAALEAELAAIERTRAGLEALNAAAPGNQETLDQIDAYTTKIVELQVLLEKTRDPFFALKETVRGASTDALTGFFEGLSRLGTQDRSEIRALTGDLQSAQAELNELMAIPAERRTGETNKRISDLRGEIEATTVSLDNAKASITTWRDLFVSALQSIADALVKVSSQMLATAIIERLLGLAIGSSLASPSQVLSGDTLGAGIGKAFGAAGGTVFGPDGVDNVPAMLTAGEVIITKPRAQRFAALLNYINFDPNPAPIPVPSAIRRYNAGGWVAAAGGSGAADAVALARSLELTVRDSHDHVVEIVERYVASPRGRDVVINHVRGSGNSLGLR